MKKLTNMRWFKFLKVDNLHAEVKQFKDIVAESTFLIRTMFFIVFGFLIQMDEIVNKETFLWAGGITIFILLLRIMALSLLRLKVFPLMFVAPRGLITILLFFSILPEDQISIVNKSLIIQVILLSIFFMMLGVMFKKSEKNEPQIS
jgi:hypothetical protein